MDATAYQQNLLYIQELLEIQKMNFVSVYLAMAVAIHFVGNRMHTYLLSSVLVLFTLFSIESLRDYWSLINQTIQTRLAIADQFGDMIPVLLQQASPAPQIFGIPFGILTNIGIFVLGWLSIVVFTIYRRRTKSDI